MRSFWRFFRAERLKWRRDWAMLTAILAPLTQVGFLFLIVWFAEDRAKLFGAGFPTWYLVNFMAWNLLVMPVTTALVAALSWDLEDKSRAWDHILTMPAPWPVPFLAKLASQLALLLMAQILLALLMLTGGLLLRAYLPVLSMGPAMPYFLFRLMLLSALASLPVIALHAWFSSRFRSLGAGLVVALLGTYGTFHFRGAERIVGLAPWGLAVQSLDLSIRAKLPSGWLYVSSALAALVLVVLGLLHFRRGLGTQNP